MGERIRNALTRNLGLKLLALAFAVVLWLVVININDPQQTRTYTVKVTVENADALAAEGKYYEITGGRDTISFRVTAKRSVHEDLVNSDFRAVADMSRLEEDLRVPVDISATRHAGQLTIANRSYYLYVTVGLTRTEKYIISPEVSGSPSEGYAVASVSVSPNVINISGPEETVSQIDSVIARCDVSGMADDIIESVVPRMLDAEGNELPQTGLALSVSTVDVAVDLQTLRTVPIEVTASEDLAPGLYLESVTAEPSEVVLMGEPAVINDVTAVSIPASAVSLANITEDTELTVDISSYLPDGVQAEDPNTRIAVRIVLEKPVERTFTIPADRVVTSWLQEGLGLFFEEESFEVTVSGYAAELDALEESGFDLEADCSGVTAETKKLTLSPMLSDRYEADDFEAKVTVSAPQTEEGADAEAEDAEDG